MRRNISRFDFNKVSAKVKKNMGFPIKIPINFHRLRLGNIKIDFEQNFKEKIYSQKTLLKSHYIGCILRELVDFSKYLKKYIEFTLKMREKTYKLKDYSNLLMPYIWLYYTREDKELQEWFYFLRRDDEIFELIKSEGPISLCSSIVQFKLETWLTDIKTAQRKINKLGNSLMEYRLGKPINTALLKQGRPQIDIMRKVEKKVIKEMYKDITLILKFVKEKRRIYHTNVISELIEKAFFDYWDFLFEESKKDSCSKKAQKWVSFFLMLNEPLERETSIKVISDYIENDEQLQIHFKSFNWEPNKLAKEIIAKLLNISIGKVENILYR
ncbi:MAG: hypothetical protein ACTSRG_23290 [Candidatus Helarchaeota archaeon]